MKLIHVNARSSLVGLNQPSVALMKDATMAKHQRVLMALDIFEEDHPVVLHGVCCDVLAVRVK